MNPEDKDAMLAALLAGEPARTPEETAARAPYERMIARIADLPEEELPPGAEERAVQRWRASRHRTSHAAAYAIVRPWESPADEDVQLEAAPSRLWFAARREVVVVAIAIDSGRGVTADEIRAAIALTVLDPALRFAAERCVELLAMAEAMVVEARRG